MKNKKFSLLVAVLLLVGVIASSCKEDGNKPESPTELDDKTIWKLIGFYDVEMGTLIEAKPKDCEECYTLELSGPFSQEYGYFFYGTTGPGSHFWLDLFFVETAVIHEVITTGVTCQADINYPYYETVNLLCGALRRLDAFTINEKILEQDTLKFYYNSHKNYLLYKKVIE